MTNYACEKEFIEEYMRSMYPEIGIPVQRMSARPITMHGEPFTLASGAAAKTIIGGKDATWDEGTPVFGTAYVGSLTVSAYVAGYASGTFGLLVDLILVNYGGALNDMKFYYKYFANNLTDSKIFNFPFVVFNGLRAQVVDVAAGVGSVSPSLKFDGWKITVN